MRRRVGFGGRSVIVTGGGSGIGLALGRELVRAGARVTLADVDGHGVRAVAAEIGAEAAEVDVTDAEAVLGLVDEVVGRHGSLDLMFNNAGIVFGGPTDEMTRSHWDRMIDVNLNGVVNGVLAAYPQMVRQGHGHIVNTASSAGLAPAVLVAAYSATKHAVVGLSGALRPEAARHGVRVSALCPGAVDTPILDAGQPSGLPSFTSAVPTGREYMAVVGLKPIPAEDFARAALRGVARNRAVIVAPTNVRAIWYLHRAAPGLFDVIARRTARRVDDLHPD